MKDIELNKQRETQERLKKALMAKKKQQLQAKREAYRRSQMDEFRDGMVSLVTDPETKEKHMTVSQFFKKYAIGYSMVLPFYILFIVFVVIALMP